MTMILTVVSNLTIAIAVGTGAGLGLRLLSENADPAARNQRTARSYS